ncbi:MAG: phosphoglucosamine mutase [Acidaminococcales bacterium]|jgi:phosphoglucosamine mutase|nr:phosphoglucosamine mutase [Acidaminococcales bacterium]
MQRLFGTDGVRGLANREITAELALKLGAAAAGYFSRGASGRPQIMIGLDTRLSGDMLAAALAAGISSAGGEAHMLGVMPTPAVAYLTAHSNACAGAVISASHNPFEDNGIKFFSHAGIKLPDEIEDEIQRLVEGQELAGKPIGDGIGRIVFRSGLADDYAQYVIKSADTDLHGLKIVLDCANGAASDLAPFVLRALGAEVIVTNNRPDGLNINKGCGSTHMEGLRKKVLEEKADLGVAHDGDADRCLMVDENGQLVDGDQLMLICALELMEAGRLAADTLVTTVMSNIGLHCAFKARGGKCVVTPVGDRYVLEEMLKNGYNFGGEQSGHIIFGDYATTGDGLMTATQVLRAAVRNNRPLSALAGLMTKYPQVLNNVKVKSKEGWQTNKEIGKAIAHAEQSLGEAGRVLVRASGTEPLLRVMLEGPDREILDELARSIARAVENELG